MEHELELCPICNELLVFPRGEYQYCEECGWPDEDFSDEYALPQPGERLDKYQPGLEFYNGKNWVESGVMRATQSDSFRGLYRKKN